jgi:type III secretory pathway component EscV
MPEPNTTVTFTPDLTLSEEAVAAAVAAELRCMLKELAVPGDVKITANRARSGAHDFPMWITIGAHRIPIGTATLAWTLSAAQGSWPPLLREDTLAQLADPDAGMLESVLRHATREAVSRCPAVLLTVSDRSALSRECGSDAEDRVLELAQRLLDMRVSLAERERIGAASKEQVAVEDAAEELIAEIRPQNVTVLVDPELLREATIASDDEGRRHFDLLRAGMYSELGIAFPAVNLRPEPALRRGFVALRLGDLTTVPFRVPFPSEAIVVGSEEAGGGTPQTRCLAHDRAASVMPADVAADLRNSGATTWSGIEYIVLGIAQLGRRFGAEMTDARSTRSWMWALGGECPQLAAALANCWQVSRLTRLLRSLLRSRIPIFDRQAIAQAIVDSPETGEELVRQRLAPLATVRFGSPVVAYMLDPQAERAEAVVDALDHELSTLSPEMRVPCVLTDDAVRPAIAAVLRTSHPDVLVTSYGELPPWLDVYPVARLATAGMEREE